MGPTAATCGRVLVVGPDECTAPIINAMTVHRWHCLRQPTPRGVLTRVRLDPDLDAVLLAPLAEVGPYIELCRHIKFDARTAFVAVIFLLPADQAARRAEVFAAGADDCIQSSASEEEIALRLTNAWRLKRATDSLEDATTVITSLANAVEGRDAYTRGHVERVAAYCKEIGRRLGLGDRELHVLEIGGIVHDIGKIAVPDQVLNKPGRLTPEEFELMKRHPVVGYDILQPLRTFRRVLPLVRWHHERPNGTGYPDGLIDKALPLLPRIVAVADVSDALSTARPYRPAFSPVQCRAILKEAAEKEDLDPRLVQILFEILDEQEAALAGVGEQTIVVDGRFEPDLER